MDRHTALRAYVRAVLHERRRHSRLRQTDSAGPGVTTDPTAAGTPYDNYNVERGVDIYGYWYRSPGDKATGGDYRPEDPAAYIGMTPPPAPSSPADITTAEGEEDGEPALEEGD